MPIRTGRAHHDGGIAYAPNPAKTRWHRLGAYAMSPSGLCYSIFCRVWRKRNVSIANFCGVVWRMSPGRRDIVRHSFAGFDAYALSVPAPVAIRARSAYSAVAQVRRLSRCNKQTNERILAIDKCVQPPNGYVECVRWYGQQTNKQIHAHLPFVKLLIDR